MQRRSGWSESLAEPTRAIGLGAGGHAKVVLETLALVGGVEVVGLLDPRSELWGTQVGGVEVLGDDDLLASQYDAGVTHAFIGLGGVGDTRPRRRLYTLAREQGLEIVDAVHPSAAISPSAAIGAGATILACAVVNADAVLGENVIVNSGAVIEHDCRLGDHVHVASGAVLASSVEVGDRVHVGAGATVRQSVTIGPGALVGAGAVVVRDVAPKTVVAGVPARLLRKVDE
jgi:sugar O-acyltransferase (sialic acid O-acetyltransferase NeuD family)